MRFFCWQKWAALFPQIFPKTPHPTNICENFHKPHLPSQPRAPYRHHSAPYSASNSFWPAGLLYFNKKLCYNIKKTTIFLKNLWKNSQTWQKSIKYDIILKKIPYFFSKNRPSPQKNKEKPAGLLTNFKKYVIIKWGIYYIYTHFFAYSPGPRRAFVKFFTLLTIILNYIIIFIGGPSWPAGPRTFPVVKYKKIKEGAATMKTAPSKRKVNKPWQNHWKHYQS